MINFAITGVAGYVAVRHLKAIKATGNLLVAALDPHDSVGVLDQYFPNADFFTQPERFDRHIEKLKRSGDGHKIDYLSICSPNYLHDAHIRMALRVGAHAICEKPLVLNPKNLDLLKEIENETGNKIYNVLQLRLHPTIIQLKQQIEIKNRVKKGNRAIINLQYITSRGKWYDYSWKGHVEKSGGLASNIGIHFFDMLIWIFGKVISNTIFVNSSHTQCGLLILENAEINWNLSIDSLQLPQKIASIGQTTFRSIEIDGQELEFSEGFADLHTNVYKSILEGGGFGLEDARAAIELVYSMR